MKWNDEYFQYSTDDKEDQSDNEHEDVPENEASSNEGEYEPSNKRSDTVENFDDKSFT